MAGCPSGQWERTVNPSAYAYAGSNPAPATKLQYDLGLPASDLSLYMTGTVAELPAPLYVTEREVDDVEESADDAVTTDGIS